MTVTAQPWQTIADPTLPRSARARQLSMNYEHGGARRLAVATGVQCMCACPKAADLITAMLYSLYWSHHSSVASVTSKSDRQ